MIRILILLFSCLLFTQCANIVPPTGGPRDTEAPKIISAYPKNGQTNYKENFITMTFDEAIVDNQLSSKILVSPTIEGYYTVKIKKNTAKVIWRDTLKENTTYSFNIIDGIKDNTEGNLLKNYSITFSTGNDIDSNTVNSIIKNIPGAALNPNLKLLLFEKTDSITNILSKKPEYIGIATDSGKVEIGYIKEKEYTAVAVADNNKNNKWDKNEPLSVKNIIVKDKITESFQIQETILDTAKVLSANSVNKTINIFFSKGLQYLKIKGEEGEYIYTKLSSRKYSIENQYNLTDTTKIQIEYIDSVGIKSEYVKKVKFKQIDLQKDKDSIINISTINKKKSLKQVIDSIQFSTDKLITKIDVEVIAPKNVTYTLTNNYNNFVLVLKGQKEKDTVEVVIPRESATSIYGEYNRNYKEKFGTDNEKNYGNIQFELKTNQTGFTTYFKNSKDEIVYTSTDKHKNQIKNLEPGEYILFVHIDTNKDGYWNAYDPISNTPAEPIYYFKEKLVIRANWDLEDIQMIF
ncbi:Ig-like domain-containing protein [Cytophaga hutchinsonii]|uniref:SbsA Ig-like domain-containing protein n=1 Tax=Cytophaga hutchinsonii (strain ATCC 33406 / DSM 1761 / CIP 103989 / NBRC 15051 / NCIMB 9469 / D465) TaxID=269798 RepID=A0A6N4SW93_CYTH3|nr:Ig-like domain-containing protein [Cytophaga hutchinsonii]ABG60737.1 conserved hypothetical protein [Cytophaga hutchinsonii ATCC 33406]SFX70824.1 Ig-like domain-containing protein [Cytophaga hutchinsonii ATCC 33406]